MNSKLACLFLLVLTAAATVSAAPISYVAFLDGNTESPPTGSPGVGFASLVIDDAASLMTISVTFSGLGSPTSVTHIHVVDGPGDTPGDTLGPVATTTPTFPGFPAGVMSGSYFMSFDMTQASSYNPSFVTAAGGVAAAQTALFDAIGDGRAYLNIHSVQFGSGEIRGFFAQTPEPATWGLMTASLAGLMLLRRKRNSIR